ncbi:major facilitator superfamily domain-containing protein 6-like [Colossoma macropomum]|uniref:major facilitator superfamily domain-containing protein 6-like n=1 Tax=Colossoma macropomum TaxID=42526 RepID=UPI00186424A3|nr:major facilitator superfamily domain-containing protein 6-like [Colossoma macropomum]
MKRSKQWDVRGAVGLAGVFHFLHCWASGCLLPFLTLYLRHLGLTASMTGIIMTAKHLVALVWRPVSSALARRHNKRRVVIIGSVICSAMAAMILLLFPPTGVSMESGSCNVSQLNANHTVYEFDSTTREPRTTPQTFSTRVAYSAEPKMRFTEGHRAMAVNHSANSVTKSASETQTVEAGSDEISSQEALETKTTQGHPPKRKSRSLRRREEKQEETDMETARSEFLGSLKVMDAQHQMFFLVMIVVGIWEVMAAPLEWTADDGLHEYLDFVDATDRHGTVKPWRHLGTAGGMGSTGILVSILYCLIGTVLHFYAYAMFMVIMVPVAALLPLYRHKRERLPGSGLKALLLVRGDPRAMLCAITALVTGMASSAISDFLLWLMQDHSASELQMGITLALAPLCQAVFAPLNGSVARFLKSHGRLLLLGILGLSLQCLYYSFLWAPWAALPAQLLAGLSTSALWWSIEAQCADTASPGTERAVFRVFEALSLDLGAGLGSLLGGFVVQKFGLGVLFQGTAVMLALWSITLAVLQWRIPRQRRINYSRLLAADASEVSESESDQDNDWLEKAMEEDKGNNNWRSSEK